MTWYNITQNRMTAGRAIISVLALLTVFCGMAAAEQLYVNEDGWWRDGGAFNVSSAPIQTAVDAAGEGDAIYIYGGNYTENVDVDKPRLTLEGEGADVVTVTAASSSDHVFNVTANYVNISGFTATGATGYPMAAIYLYNANHCNIYDNTANSNRYGIYLYWYSSNNTLTSNTANSNYQYGIYLQASSNNTLTNNIASNNNCYGIRLYSSSNNTLTSNTANSNRYGIRMDESSNNTLTDNTMSGNGYDFGVTGNSLSKYTHNIDTSNTVDGKMIYYWVDQHDNQIPSDAGFVGVVNSTNITVSDLTLTNNFQGVLFAYTENSRVENVVASNNAYGIYLYESSNNTLTSNTANSNYQYGIYLQASSNNTLTSNIISDNRYGICLDNADNSNINCNWVQNNIWRGFCLHSGSTGNTIEDNNIIENGNYNTETGGWEWQFYIAPYQPVEAKHNYWGAGMNSSTIYVSIYDYEEGGYGEVEFYPFETEPVPCAPTPEEPHTFTTTDVVIALQIAAGSRGYNSHWDVSGDNRVTSLDALMILQAAAGNPEVPSGGCKGLDQNVLRRYDHEKSGLIESNEMETAKIGYENNYETQSDYEQILYAYEHKCLVEPN